MATATKTKRKAEWQNRYRDKTYDLFSLMFPKGEKEQLKAHVEKFGKGTTASLNGYINKAIKEAIERDLSPPPKGL